MQGMLGPGDERGKEEGYEKEGPEIRNGGGNQKRGQVDDSEKDQAGRNKKDDSDVKE